MRGFGDFLWMIPGLLTAITFHEYAHGWMADQLGDPTPRYTGRLTLNPLAHIDPVGMLMLLIFHFGWAKPVQVNPRNFRDPKRGMLYVGLAGPTANLILAYSAMVITGAAVPLQSGVVGTMFRWVIRLNVFLAAFNVLPVPPLDGSKILAGLLPDRYAYVFNQMQQYGWVILIVLLWTGVIGRLLGPLSNFLFSLLRVLARPLVSLMQLGF